MKLKEFLEILKDVPDDANVFIFTTKGKDRIEIKNIAITQNNIYPIKTKTTDVTIIL